MPIYGASCEVWLGVNGDSRDIVGGGFEVYR